MSAQPARSSSDTAPDPHHRAKAVAEEVRGLVSPPDVCMRVLELVRSERASADDIAQVVATDPALTVRLLRIVNSPLYGLRGRIETVPRAVTVLGIDALSSLVVAVSAVASFGRIPSKLVNMDTFWRHGVLCGLIARALARRARVLHPERLFTAGLLHDIGSLVLYHQVPDTMRGLLTAADGAEQRLYDAELATFGYAHAQLGGLLLESWGLPATLHDAVTWHHEPARAEHAPIEAAILHLAEKLANHGGLGAYCEGAADEPPPPEADWLACGLEVSESDLEDLLGQAGQEFGEVVALLAVRR
ncbi:MAG: HDOD domain-containing protein [Gammaproteobacteria bacterium]